MTQSFSTGQQLRQAMRGVASTVTLLATVTPEGSRHAMLASSFTSVSLEPATVLVCVGRHTDFHAHAVAAGRLSVHILHGGQRAQAQVCGQQTGEARFADSDWCQDELTGLPYLQQAQAVLLCELWRQHDAGTHSVLLARVVRVQMQQAIAPLVYLDGKFVSAC